jgi:hypothetical protein
MLFYSIERFDRQRRFAGLESLPIGQQFILVQLGPSLDEATLPPRDFFIRKKPNLDGTVEHRSILVLGQIAAKNSAVRTT